MKVNLVDGNVAEIEADLLAIPISSSLASPALTQLSEASGVDLAAMAADEHFKGEVGKTFLWRGLPNVAARRVVLVGIGDDEDVSQGSYRRAGVAASRVAREVRAQKAAVVVESPEHGPLSELAMGWDLGGYRFSRHRSKTDDSFSGNDELVIVGTSSDEARAAIDHGRLVARAVMRARDLVNEPPNELVPETLAQAARGIGSAVGLETKILGENALTEKGFNLIMAVGKGSEHPPRLIHLVYRPEGEAKRKIALVGKGVTFDTGGYNLKPGGSLLNMHCDMAGAAAVLGAAQAIGELKPKDVEIHFIVPTAENAVAHNAFKPNDIFRGYGGKTVEIHNTDAEGRLILADALAYAQEQGVDTVIDLATLTGACVIALGEGTAGLFATDDELAEQLLEASRHSGEHLWRMPLTQKMDKLLDTTMADMKNVGPRWGGAITAALFLKRWIEVDKWAHLDIAGPAWTEKDDDLAPEGGTGFGVATLVAWVQSVGGR